jgi:hypothetical protein
MAGWNWKRAVEVAGLAIAIVGVVFAGLTYASRDSAATQAISVAPDFLGPWHGSLDLPPSAIAMPSGLTFNFTLKLHSGGLHSVVGSISSPQFDCSVAVSLDGGSGNGPYVLGLTAPGNSVACQVVSEIQRTTVALTGDLLQFTVQFDGGSESCDLSR